MAEKIKGVIYPGSETAEQKRQAIEEERRRIRGDIKGDPEEERLQAISPKEAEEAVKEANEIRKQSRGLMAHEFGKMWLGKDGKSGLKELADWTFSRLFRIAAFGVNRPEDLKEKKGAGVREAYNEWKELIEPSLKRLAKEISEIGAQEHILQFFSEEWQPGHGEDDKRAIKDVWERVGELEKMEKTKNEVWQIWREYSNKAN